VDGASVSGITVSNIRMRGVMTPFFIRLGNRGRDRDVKIPGKLEHIVMRDISALNCDFPPSVTGISSAAVQDVSLENIQIVYVKCEQNLAVQNPPPEREDSYPESTMFGDLPAHGLFARHVKGLAVRGFRAEPRDADTRPKYIFDDVEKFNEFD
jgi:hypothetical protein